MKKTMLKLSSACAVVFLLLAHTALSGGLMQYTTTGNSVRQAQQTNITTDVYEQVAVTVMRQTFINPSIADTAGITYGVGLSSAAMVTQIRWCIDGQWMIGSMQSSDTANPTGGGGAATASFSANFDASQFIFPFKQKLAPADTIIVEVTTMEVLPFTAGLIEYVYPMGTRTFPSDRVADWTFTLRAQRDVLSFSSAFAQSVDSSKNGMVTATARNFTGAELRVRYSLKYDGLTMNVLSTKPADEDGYALMMAVPSSSNTNSEVLSKRFTFVMDRSGSMGTVKMRQARDAAQYCVERLNPRDLINVIRFDAVIEKWSPTHQLATPENVANAVNYIQAATARGGTNIMDAVATALAGMQNDNYVNVIVFLTDGMATVDLLALKMLNTSSTRLFVFGVGDNVAKDMLSQLAEQNNGSAEFITDIGAPLFAIERLWEKIRDPLVKNPKVSFSPAVVYDVYPGVIPDIYAGEQLMLVGRYTAPGKTIVAIDGTDVRGTVHHQYDAFLTDRADVNAFVGKVWAKQRIAALLELMKTVSQNSGLWTEWRDEIIRLGVRYGIVTQFTKYADDGIRDTGGGSNGGGGNGGGNGGGGSGGSGGGGNNGGGGTSTSVEDDAVSIAEELTTVSPNPGSTHFDIVVDLSEYETENVVVQIVDVLGNVVATLYNGPSTHAKLRLTWNGATESGIDVSTGMYLLTIDVGGDRSATTVQIVR